MNSLNYRFYFLYIFILFLNYHQIICENPNIDNKDNAQSHTTKSCPFSGTRYPLGESWFRRLDTHEMSYCVACNCAEGGKSNCTSKPCNSLIQLCEEATDLSDIEKGCCQQCQETDFTERVEIHVNRRIDSMPSSPKTPTKISCLHNGKIYYDSQVFASNTSGIHKTQANQCVQCICQTGLVLCRLKTCFADSCSSLKADNNSFNEDCCPLRANCQDKPIRDEDNYKKEDHLVTIYSPNDGSLGTNQRFSPQDCKSGGKIYFDGAKWHPIIGPFGQMDCVICNCNAGNVECSRINCQSFQRFSCLKPKRIQGQCCLTCSDQHINDNEKITSAKEIQTTNPSIMDFFNGSEDETNKKSHKKSDEVLNVICLPLKMNTIVYRSHAQSSISAYYQYAFQTNATNKSTDSYSFTIKEGKIADFSQQHLTNNEFGVLSQSFKFKLMGATKSKFVEKFAKRTKKFPQLCSQRCKTRVERLERSLRIKEVAQNRSCLTNEVQFF